MVALCKSGTAQARGHWGITMAGEPFYVVKVIEFPALNFLQPDHQRPTSTEWIDRSEDRLLRINTVKQLLRTLYKDDVSPNVADLQNRAGLRLYFPTAGTRDAFAREFRAAASAEAAHRKKYMTTIFPAREDAAETMAALEKAGVAAEAMSLLWQGNQVSASEFDWPAGRSTAQVAGTVAGSGLAGAALGVALLLIPGIGPVAATGTLAASAFTSVATISGVIGATGGAVAEMLDDLDVDDLALNHFEQQLRRGKVFLAIDRSNAPLRDELILALVNEHGGHAPAILNRL